MIRKAFFAAVAAFALAGTAHAYDSFDWRSEHQARNGRMHQGFDSRIDQRQAQQHARIADGVARGALTRREARALQAEQAAIRAEEHRYRSDGWLTRAELLDLHRDLDRASRHISFELNDHQRRY